MQFTVRLTSENLTDELRPGDVIMDDPDLSAPITSVRLTHDGYDNAKIVWADGQRDTLGLPSTVTIKRGN